jgi:hypothetical protein
MSCIRILIFLLTTFSVKGQDTQWLKPAKYLYKVGDTCRISLQQGERLIGKYYSVSKDSAGTFISSVNGNVVDLTNDLVSDQRHHFVVPLREEGTYQFTWDRSRVFELSTLAGLEGYLNENGLGGMPVTGERTFTVHEHVYDILLVQSGARRTTITAAGNFPLQIVPEKNPYELKRSDPLTLFVKNHSAPVFGFEVVVRNRYDDRTTIQKIYTEKDGSFRMIVSSPGPWMISYSVIDAYRNPGTFRITRVNLLFGY